MDSMTATLVSNYQAALDAVTDAEGKLQRARKTLIAHLGIKSRELSIRLPALLAEAGQNGETEPAA